MPGPELAKPMTNVGRLDWRALREAVDLVRRGDAKRVDGAGWKVYTLGDKKTQPIRIDIDR